MADMIDIPDAVFESVRPTRSPVMPKAPAEEKPKTVVRKPDKPDPEPKAESDDKPEPRETKEPEEPKPAEKKIWKLKALGKEVDFDASDDEQVKRYLEKGLGADETFQSAAQLRKQAETFFDMLKDPKSLRKVLEDPRVGHDFKKLAEDYVWESIQEAEATKDLTDEQKEWRRKAKRADELEAEKIADKEKADSQEKQKRQELWESDYEKKIIAALQVKGVPQTHKAVAEMAWYIEKAIENNHDISPDDIATYVIQQQRDYFKANFDDMDEDQLADFIGEHNAEKIRRRDLKKLKSPTGSPFQERRADTPKKEAPKSRKMDGHDWKAALMKDPMFKS